MFVWRHLTPAPHTLANAGNQRNAFILLITKFAKVLKITYRVADKSLARPGRKQATATEDFDFHISYL